MNISYEWKRLTGICHFQQLDHGSDEGGSNGRRFSLGRVALPFPLPPIVNKDYPLPSDAKKGYTLPLAAKKGYSIRPTIKGYILFATAKKGYTFLFPKETSIPSF